MQIWTPFAGLVLLAFLATLTVTPVIRTLAIRLQLVDRPDAHRKMHERAIPLGGGVAILAGALIALAAACFVQTWWDGVILAGRRSLAGLGMAVVVLCLVGLVDDIKGLRARQKFAGQILAALVLMSSGLVIHNIQFFHWQIELGLLAWPVTLFWFLGAINSVNLLDGADGLATTVGIVLTGTIAGMAFITGNGLEAIIAFAMMGSLLGFLVYNRPPASIYLGDAGSMFIGLIAGVLAMRCSMKGPATFALAAPIAVWAIPAFDSLMAIVRRKLTGRSLATTDRGHLHHCLQRQGVSSRQLVLWVGVLCLTNGAGALLSLWLNDETYAYASIVIVVAALVSTRVFGHSELLLLTAKFRSLGLSLVTPAWQDHPTARASSVHLQGSQQWESIWAFAIQQFAALELTQVRLNINLPWLHESYHASWNQDRINSGVERWHSEMPLKVNGRPIGQLKLSGYSPSRSMEQRLVQLAQFISQLEARLSTLIEGFTASSPPSPIAAHPPEGNLAGVAPRAPLDFGAELPSHQEV